MPKQRTGQQNNSLHEFCRELANELNAKGITQAQFSAALECDNTMESVKDSFRQIGFKKYLAQSTADLTTMEIQNVYDEVMRVVAFHPEWNLKHIDWPSIETK